MDSNSGDIASAVRCIHIYPNVTEVDPSKFSVDEDLDALSQLLTTHEQASPNSPGICFSSSSGEEECNSNVEESNDMEFVELINEKQFDMDDSFMYLADEEEHFEETVEAEGEEHCEETEEEEHVAENEAVDVTGADSRNALESLMLMCTTRSIATETDNLISRSMEVQTDMVWVEKGTCGYIDASRENQVLVYSLRCYYCAQIFPIWYWQKFISHVNTVHNVLEKMEADIDLKVATSSAPAVQPNDKQSKVCILKNIVLPKLPTLPAATNQPGTANVDNTSHDNVTQPSATITTLTAECDTKFETYNSNFSWHEVWDSDSDAESTSETNSYSPNMDHCYTQELRARLANTARSLNSEEKSEKEQDSDAYEIRFDQTDSAIVMDFLELLTSFPVLWCSRTNSALAYDAAIVKLYKILNIRWELNLTASSFHNSLEKIKAWYRSTLVCTNVRDSPNGYTARYEEYFRKCAEFLPAFDDDQPPDLLCDICNENCDDDANLLVHKYQVHAAGQLPYECGVCGARFWYVDGLGIHLNRHKRTQPLPKPLIFPAGKGKRRMKCEKCNRILYQEAAMELHMAEHANDERAYFCELCDERFALVSDYRAHKKRSHNWSTHKCELCGQEFNTGHSFSDHMKVHRRHFDYLCDICGKLFIRNRSFKEHMQCVHQGLAHCDICNFDFHGLSALHTHRLRFHLVWEGAVEELARFTICKRGPGFKRKCKYERIYDSPTSKRYRLRCPHCPQTYYGYDSLHAHALRVHGQQIQALRKKTKSANVEAHKKKKRRNIASIFPDLAYIHEDAANLSVAENNASSATAVDSAPKEVPANVADSVSSKPTATPTADVTTSAVTATLSMPELLSAEEETTQATIELKKLNVETLKIQDERLFANDEAEFEYILNAAAMELEGL